VPGSLLVDDIVARAVSGGAAPTVAPVAVPQTAMTGPIALLFDSTNLRIAVDTNRNGVIDAGETTYASGSSFFGVPLTVSTVAATARSAAMDRTSAVIRSRSSASPATSSCRRARPRRTRRSVASARAASASSSATIS
jgi:Flp pilus assembly protein TadB